ncbi:2-polyprenyl-3-methyl-6-methoxy-1,4-benzoquinone monooxygenase, partial [Alloalcanivorax venustensis]
MTERHFSPMDRLLSRVDSALRTLTPGSARAERQPPNADPQPEAPLNPSERRHVTGLMRINHTGEVCAQALYQGQASTATLPHVRHAMEAAAREEEDHLAWCDDRIRELGGVPSRLNPLFYAVSYALGAGAGLAGDRWSLGFVSETEHQVVRHLENHLTRLPAGDRRSRAILEQMREDELRHAVTAEGAG